MSAPYLMAAAVLLADQLLKFWIVDVVRLEEAIRIRLLPVFSLTWVENRGIAMGMLDLGDNGRWLLVALTAAIAAGVAWWIPRERSRLDRLALGAILGGAIGNIVDRVRLGYVIDFAHFHVGTWSFYVFNLADAAITIGVLVLLINGLAGSGDKAEVTSRS